MSDIRILNGLHERKIHHNGKTAELVLHPLGGFSIVVGNYSYGVVEINEHPEFGIGLVAELNQPGLKQDGWYWYTVNTQNPFFGSVRAAVVWALDNLAPHPCAAGKRSFSDYLAIVGAEHCW